MVYSDSSATKIRMETAQVSESFTDHFGIENIPFGIGSSGRYPTPQCVSRYKDSVIFLFDIASLLEEVDFHSEILRQPTLNAFAALGRDTQQKVRSGLQELIRNGALPEESCENIASVVMHLPVSIGDFTDFSCSPHHNRNAGEALLGMSRGLPPGYLHMPLGKNNRGFKLLVSRMTDPRLRRKVL